MRSLLELRDGTLGEERMGAVEHGPTTDQRHRAARLFGNAVKEGRLQRPSRVIVRDAYLDKAQKESAFFKNADLPYTEVKTEVVIDRITSRAMPRQIERVPAGAKFDFSIVLNLFDGHDNSGDAPKINADEQDNETELIKDLFAAMQLLQNDYIGAAGSRGSGQIQFDVSSISVKKRDRSFYEMNGSEVDVTADYKQYFPK
jgi:CRISPR-associated protein Csm3